MSLGIFSFDLAALINSLSNFLETPETQAPPINQSETTLDSVAEVLQNSTAAIDSKIDDVLMAAALSSTITSVITAAETSKKETPPPTNSPTVPVPAPKVGLDEETRKEIERLIKLLQTSVTHNYRSSDIIDEAVSLNRVTNFPRREQRENSERRNESIEQDRKREAQKLELLRDELKKAMLKNNANV